ncbi:Uncharacterised protein [Mycobacteroides abscessus subsp. abscessus]|nr:Uncharacterised protein [Mycobacteroides abscessus subsp. abscessus]
MFTLDDRKPRFDAFAHVGAYLGQATRAAGCAGTAADPCPRRRGVEDQSHRSENPHHGLGDALTEVADEDFAVGGEHHRRFDGCDELGESSRQAPEFDHRSEQHATVVLIEPTHPRLVGCHGDGGAVERRVESAPSRCDQIEARGRREIGYAPRTVRRFEEILRDAQHHLRNGRFLGDRACDLAVDDDVETGRFVDADARDGTHVGAATHDVGVPVVEAEEEPSR